MNGNRAKILEVGLNSTSAGSVLSTMVELAMTQGGRNKPTIVFTPNPEFLVEARKDKDFKDLLNRSDINLVDGFGLVLAGGILKRNVGERISGADVVERLLEEGNQKKWTIGVTGARKGDPDEIIKLFQELRTKYQNIDFVNLDNLDFQKSLKIKNLKFEIVLACHGMKKQEQWIWENKDKIKANVFMGVGGSLDFLTGFSRRAPSIIRRIGLEWLWRGLHKPQHFKRIWKATAVFGWMVLKEKLSLVLGLNSK